MADCFDCFLLIISCFSFLLLIEAAVTKVKDLEIVVEDKPEVCDDFAAIGDQVYVDYTGMLKDGRIFDSSLQEGRSPLKFKLGAGTLIKGWERGVQGMCIGEKRKLRIPPHLGYGSKGIDGVIPPESTLLFQVHLVNIERPSIFNQLHIVVQFAIWPAGVLLILYYLYRKINSAEKDHERKTDKRSGKKRR